MTMKTKCMATAIGSFPHTDAERVLDIVFASLPEAPIWPQLPKLGLYEQMEIQYSEGMPRAIIDPEKGRMYFDTSGDYSEDFAAFYESYLAASEQPAGRGDFSALAISPHYAQGIYRFLERLKNAGKKFPFIKVQTTGPCSFALTITDENKRAVFYNEEFKDMVVKALAMKCRWQIQTFQPYADKIICFIDEPILSAFGSSTYISVRREDVVSLIGEVAQAIKDEGAIAGVHCCGNTDWTILMDAGVDLINLDAFGYGETIALYAEAVNKFIMRGGLIAWGIVPTSAAIREQTVAALEERLLTLVDNLALKIEADRQTILEQALLTPSCGTGSLSVPDAEMVFALLKNLSRQLRNLYQL